MSRPKGVRILYVPGVGFEPTWSRGPTGFKPVASSHIAPPGRMRSNYTWLRVQMFFTRYVSVCA